MIRCDECGFLVTAEHKTNRFGSHYTDYHCSWRRLDYQCVPIAGVVPQIEGKLIKAIAIMSKQRSPILPMLATAQEQGLADFEVETWYAVFLPKDTPAGIVRKLTLPTVTLLAPIAPVAWIPLAIVAFGIGDWSAIFVVFVGIYFTLTLATVKAMTNVEPVYLDAARVLGASRIQVMFHVVLPAAIPALFDLVRMNLFGAWMGVLAAEMVGVNTGLGAIVMVGRQMMNMNLTFLGMAMIGLVGFLLDAAFGLVQRRVLWWRRATEL